MIYLKVLWNAAKPKGLELKRPETYIEFHIFAGFMKHNQQFNLIFWCKNSSRKDIKNLRKLIQWLHRHWWSGNSLIYYQLHEDFSFEKYIKYNSWKYLIITECDINQLALLCVQVAMSVYIFISRPGEARGCSINTFVIHSLIN